MKKPTKALVYNFLAFLLALLALFTSWLWVYYINLFITLPSLIGAFFLCRLANNSAPGNTFTKVNYALMASAVLVGIVMLFLLLIKN